MTDYRSSGSDWRRERGDLARAHVRLRQALFEVHPDSPTYRLTLTALTEIGEALVELGYAEDLNRLLRFRVLDGDRVGCPTSWDIYPVP